MAEIEMIRGDQARMLLESVERYWPGSQEEKRVRLLGVLNRLLDEKVLDHLHRKYQGKSWEGLVTLFEDLENLPAYEKQEAVKGQLAEKLKRGDRKGESKDVKAT